MREAVSQPSCLRPVKDKLSRHPCSISSLSHCRQHRRPLVVNATLPHIEEVERDEATALAGTREHAEVLGPALPENLYQWLSEAGEPVFEQPFLMDFSDIAHPQAEAVMQPAKHKTADRYVEVLRATTGAGTPDAYVER